MNVLESIGIVSLLCIGAFILFDISVVIRNWIQDTVDKYKIKTRFKKPPTAKCYCRDCENFEPRTGKCFDQCNSRMMSPSWFCCFAEPLTGRQLLQRNLYFKERDNNEMQIL